MSEMAREILKRVISDKKYDQVSKTASILHPGKTLHVCEYAGDIPRLMKRGNDTYLLCPYEMSHIQECGLAESIEKGLIFDDANAVDNHADYLTKTVLPVTAIINSKGVEPKTLKIVLTGIIGKIGDDGRPCLDDNCMKTGEDFINHICSGSGIDHVRNSCDHYMGIDNADDHQSLPKDIRHDISDLIKEIDNIADVDPDDEITDDDFELLTFDEPDSIEEVADVWTNANGGTGGFVDADDTGPGNSFNESYYEESFRTRHPKKLKPIPRDIIAYISVEINAIRDENDQAMLAGYTSSKLELVDFYLNCIDTDDPRYIVPHTRQYLVQMQNELNDLLKRILAIRPIHKADRMWKGVL